MAGQDGASRTLPEAADELKLQQDIQEIRALLDEESTFVPDAWLPQT
jgi:hypothetical protein